MIGLINSVCITLLFSAWVWTLKQDLNQPAHDGPAGLTPVPEDKPATHRGPIRRAEAVLFDQNGKDRDKQGVATWTIA